MKKILGYSYGDDLYLTIHQRGYMYYVKNNDTKLLKTDDERVARAYIDGYVEGYKNQPKNVIIKK